MASNIYKAAHEALALEKNVFNTLENLQLILGGSRLLNKLLSYCLLWRNRKPYV